MESYLLLALLSLTILLALLLFRTQKPSSASEPSAAAPAAKAPLDNKVILDPAAEARYLINHLRPTSTPLSILYVAATSPDMIAITRKHLEVRRDVVDKKLAALAKKNETHSMEDLLADDDGWAADDDDDETAAAKRAAEQKEKEANQLAAATGKEDVTKLKLEGIDEGVLGAGWVERRCVALKCWPPPGYDGDPSTDEAVKRNLLMTMGRLHAKVLNTDPELLKAGPEGMIDRTYFNSTLDFRGRVGQILEAALKMACTLKSHRLAEAVLDATIMFKIGLMDVRDERELAWFRDMMARQYGVGGTPKLIFGEKYLGVPVEDVTESEGGGGEEKENNKETEKKKIVQLVEQTKAVTTTDEKMSLEIHVTRQHAEAFTKEKLMQCQKQGIPPQIGMQTYKETWFIMVRARKLGGQLFSDKDVNYGDDHLATMAEHGHKLYEMLDSETVAAFRKEFVKEHRADRRLVVAWPFEVKNVAQKAGKVTMNLLPPEEEGRYEFTVTFKSMDFLGVDEEFTLVLDVKKGIPKKEVQVEVGDKKND